MPILNRLIDENSQWAVRLYLANIGPTPFLLNQSATLHVRDSNGASYDEDCYLVLLSKSESGSYERKESTSPLVLRSESDVEFEFFTNSSSVQ